MGTSKGYEGQEEGFYVYISSERKDKENESHGSVRQGIWWPKIWLRYSVLTSKVCSKASQIPDTRGQVCGSGALPRTEENQVRDNLKQIRNVHGMGQNTSKSYLEGSFWSHFLLSFNGHDVQGTFLMTCWLEKGIHHDHLAEELEVGSGKPQVG